MVVTPPVKGGLNEKCTPFFGPLNNSGYGQVMMTAHRLSWMLNHGDIPKGLDVLHTCGNRTCVNPKHLRLGTDRENMRDKYSHFKPRQNWRNGQNKLTAEQVRQIRLEYCPPTVFGRGRKTETSIKGLARKYGVHDRTIRGIVKKWSWHID